MMRRRIRLWAWTATLVTVGSYFMLMFSVAIIPAVLARPLLQGGTVSVGLLCGVLVISLCIGTSAVYTIWRNTRGEPR